MDVIGSFELDSEMARQFWFQEEKTKRLTSCLARLTHPWLLLLLVISSTPATCICLQFDLVWYAWMFLVWWRVIVTIFAHQLGRYNEELLGVLHHEGGHAGQDRVAGLSRMNMSLRRWQIICPTWSSSGFSHRGHTRWVIKIVAREEADILFSASRACKVYSQIQWKAVMWEMLITEVPWSMCKRSFSSRLSGPGTSWI